MNLCETCRFKYTEKRRNSDQKWHYCHRYPPVRSPGGDGLWPVIQPEDGCGEHALKGDGN